MNQENGAAPPRTEWNLSKLDYLGMGISAIFLLGGTGESIIFSICILIALFGKRIYRIAAQTNAELVVGVKPEIIEQVNKQPKMDDLTATPKFINDPDYMPPESVDIKTTINKIIDEASIAGKELITETQRKWEEARNFAKKKKQYVESIKTRSTCKPLEVVILGGAGWENKMDSKFMLSMNDSTLYMSDLVSLVDTSIDTSSLREIVISGPGKVTTNGNVMGGGFGAEGALKGIAIATILNILTTHSNTKTFIRMSFHDSEIIMLTSQIEPDGARILLSQLFLKLNRTLESPQPLSRPTKNCPYCAETIKLEAIFCRFCNQNIQSNDAAKNK